MPSTVPRRGRLPSSLFFAGTGLVAAGSLAVLLAGTEPVHAVTPSVASCTAPSASAGEIDKNIDTTLGCSVASGTAFTPTTGWMTVHMPGGVTSATGLDVFEANVKGGDHPYYAGDYVVSFTTVVGGTATGASYTVAPTTAQYPTPPAMAHPLTFTATTAGGTVQAQYSIAFTGSLPAAKADIASMTNNLFVWFGSGSPSTHVRTESVKPFDPIPPSSTPTPTPTPTPTATPTPTPTATPTATPTGSAGAATSTPHGGVQGIISVPSTGGGPSGTGIAGLIAMAVGALSVAAGSVMRRRTRTEA